MCQRDIFQLKRHLKDDEYEKESRDEKETGKSYFLHQLSLQYISNFSEKGIQYTSTTQTSSISSET